MLNMKVEFYRGPKITVVKVHQLVLQNMVQWLDYENTPSILPVIP